MNYDLTKALPSATGGKTPLSTGASETNFRSQRLTLGLQVRVEIMVGSGLG